VGQNLFAAFPDNPGDSAADGIASVRTSLLKVLKSRQADAMPVIRYDVKPAKGPYQPRYWAITNTPILGEDGYVRWIINRAEDVTELVELRAAVARAARPFKQAHLSAGAISAEIVSRALTAGGKPAKMKAVIYHNPLCSNSRKALQVLQDRGIAPTVVEYLKEPLSRGELAALIQKMGVSVRDVVRTQEPLYAELKLEAADDEALLAALAQHPILLNRPIVVTPRGAKLCRPGETVVELL
jgi:arsenate reductase